MAKPRNRKGFQAERQGIYQNALAILESSSNTALAADDQNSIELYRKTTADIVAKLDDLLQRHSEFGMERKIAARVIITAINDFNLSHGEESLEIGGGYISGSMLWTQGTSGISEGRDRYVDCVLRHDNKISIHPEPPTDDDSDKGKNRTVYAKKVRARGKTHSQDIMDETASEPNKLSR